MQHDVGKGGIDLVECLLPFDLHTDEKEEFHRSEIGLVRDKIGGEDGHRD